ncbi:MAG: CHAT domain-containing protein [Bacteroidales bacterium]|nr:CHAT domain-containing protein [Bacteroidales bacterium]
MIVISFFAISGSEPPEERKHKTISFLEEKAKVFHHKDQFDSAQFYYEQLKEAYLQNLRHREFLNTEISLADLLIMKQDHTGAREILMKINSEIKSSFSEDPEIIANFLQVLGGYYLATGNLDSARYSLEKSIVTRQQSSGEADTLLRYAWNKLGNYYLKTGDYETAQNCHQTALNLSLLKKNKVNFQSASSYQNLGIAVHMQGDYALAEKYFLMSLELNEKLYEPSDPAIAPIFINIGKFYNDLSKYNLALVYYNKADTLLSKAIPEQPLIQFAPIYWNKGNLFTHMGDFEKAISFLQRALQIYQMQYDSLHPQVQAILMDIGFVYNKKGDNTLAIKYYQQATRNTALPSTVKAYRNIGNIYIQNKKSDSAKIYLLSSIDAAKRFFGSLSYDLAYSYLYYGELFRESGNLDSSNYYFGKSLGIFEKLFAVSNRDIARMHILLAANLISQKQYDQALSHLKTGLEILFPGYEDRLDESEILAQGFKPDLYIPDALYLKSKALYNRYTFKKDITDLNTGLQSVQQAWTIIEEIRRTYRDEESQIILNNNARMTVDIGLKVCLALFDETGNTRYLTEAFEYGEKGKAIVLLGALRGIEAKSLADIPAKIIANETSLSGDIALYSNLIYEESKKKAPDHNKIGLWNDKLFACRRAYDSLLSVYEQDYPEYFSLRYDYSVISADSIAQIIPGDQALISYHISDTTVYGFFITGNSFYPRVLCSRDSLYNKLNSLLNPFRNREYFNAGREEFDLLARLSYELYGLLLQPFEPDITDKRLLIIPDGELGYLAFDLLLKSTRNHDSGNYKELDWLIRSHPVSYSSSATIYFEQEMHQKTRTRGRLIAFAPSYDIKSATRQLLHDDSIFLNLAPITGSVEEVKAIARYFPARKLFNEKASEANFKSIAPNFSVLHLAMHTLINNEKPLYSKLVFSPPLAGSSDDGYLNTYELFNLQLNGELAVLSACNTGTGKLERGEGVISLARGFFYAGIPSVVMTLWEIEDHSSADLMKLFYSNLRKGLHKDVALQQAKLAYLENAGRLQSHPYYWSGFVNIGNNSPVKTGVIFMPWHCLLGGFAIMTLLLLATFFINRRVYFHRNGH